MCGSKIGVPSQPSCPDDGSTGKNSPREVIREGPSVPVRYVPTIPPGIADIAQLDLPFRGR